MIKETLKRAIAVVAVFLLIAFAGTTPGTHSYFTSHDRADTVGLQTGIWSAGAGVVINSPVIELGGDRELVNAYINLLPVGRTQLDNRDIAGHTVTLSAGTGSVSAAANAPAGVVAQGRYQGWYKVGFNSTAVHRMLESVPGILETDDPVAVIVQGKVFDATYGWVAFSGLCMVEVVAAVIPDDPEEGEAEEARDACEEPVDGAGLDVDEASDGGDGERVEDEAEAEVDVDSDTEAGDVDAPDEGEEGDGEAGADADSEEPDADAAAGDDEAEGEQDGDDAAGGQEDADDVDADGADGEASGGMHGGEAGAGDHEDEGYPDGTAGCDQEEASGEDDEEADPAAEGSAETGDEE